MDPNISAFNMMNAFIFFLYLTINVLGNWVYNAIIKVIINYFFFLHSYYVCMCILSHQPKGNANMSLLVLTFNLWIMLCVEDQTGKKQTNKQKNRLTKILLTLIFFTPKCKSSKSNPYTRKSSNWSHPTICFLKPIGLDPFLCLSLYK